MCVCVYIYIYSCINCTVERVVWLRGGRCWQRGTVQGAAKMNILKEENILFAQTILKHETECNKF